MVVRLRKSVGAVEFVSNLMLVSLVWLSFSLNAMAAEPSHVLTLADGSICYGSLLPNTTEGQLVFQVDGLVQPLEFPQSAVVSLRKLTTEDTSEKAQANSTWLVRLKNQQAVVGRLQSLDHSGLTILSSSLGSIEIPREHLVRIEQDFSAKVPIETVLRKSDWKDPNDKNGWKIDPFRLSTSTNGARLISDFGVPGRCEIRMTLRWSKNPNFAICFGVDKNSASPERKQWAAQEGVPTIGRRQSFAAIETWGDELLFVRESSSIAAFEQLGTTAGLGCELTIYLDIKGGLAAARINNSPLVRLQVESKAVAGKLQAMQFQSFSGDLAIENIQIYKWNGRLPLEYAGQPSFVQMTSGEKLDGYVERYDSDANTFTVKSSEQEKVILLTDFMAGALTEVPEPIETPVQQSADPSATTPASAVAPKENRAIVKLIDGSVLVGSFLPAEGGQLRLSSDLVTQSFHIPIAAIREISCSNGVTEPSDEADVMIAKCGLSELKGRLVQPVSTEGDDNGSINKSAIIWKQLLSVNSSELDFSVSGELGPLPKPAARSKSDKRTSKSNKPRAAAAAQNEAFELFGLAAPANDQQQNAKLTKQANASEPLTGSLIRFRSGDSTTAKILEINEKGVRFESDLTSTNFAPNSSIDQVVFRAAKNTALPDDQRKRLLTIPRVQQNDPPTHLLISIAGDFLRGHLVEVDGVRAVIEVRGDMLEVPVAELSEVVWLYDRDWKTPKEKNEEQVGKPDVVEQKNNEVFIVYGDNKGIALHPTKVSDGRIFGVSELLGKSQVPISELTVLFWGPDTGAKARQLRNQSYRLTLAQMPRESPDDEQGGSSQSTLHPLVGKPAPDFSLKDLSEQTVKLENLRGKVIVLDFWATWCGPCMQTMPLMEQMMAEFDSAKVQFFAVNIQEANSRIKSALSRLNIDPQVLLDEEGEVGAAYQANAIPQTVIIDEQGTVVNVFVGGGAGVVKQIRQALVDHLETSKN